jgi:hypothetical protein
MSPDNRREYASVAHPAYKVRCTSFAAQERRCIFKEVLMKLYWIALCGLAVAKIAFAASPTADEESVYRSYLAAFSAITSLEDRTFEQYLSTSARNKWAEVLAKRSKRECSPCPTEKQELEMAKTMRPIPAASLRPVREETPQGTTLTFKWSQPGASSKGATVDDMTVVVELVKEHGSWKLKRESWAMVSGSFKSTGQARWSS